VPGTDVQSILPSAFVGFGPEPPRDDQGRPLDSRLVHIGRDTAFGMVLRSNFWLGWGLPEPAVPDEVGLNLTKHSQAGWLYLAEFLPALAIAEQRNVNPPPAAW
jgi:hypothetical protein